MLLAGQRHLKYKVQRLVTSCGARRCVAVQHIVVVPKAPPLQKSPKKVLSEATKAAIRERRPRASRWTVAQQFGIHVSTVSAIAGALPPKDKEEAA